jgi:hypothetical protein
VVERFGTAETLQGLSRWFSFYTYSSKLAEVAASEFTNF